MKTFAIPAVAALCLGACTPATIMGLPGPEIPARMETEPVGTANEDAADDPAIWRNRSDPAASLIVATDKKAGLYVYGLDGKVRSFVKAGLVNNVDLIETPVGIYAIASDRSNPAKARLALFRLDTQTAQLNPIGSVSGGDGEAYGICVDPRVTREDGVETFTVFSVPKEGQIRAVRVGIGADGASVSDGGIVAQMGVPSQPEGCVVDTAANALYIGEENAGIWRFDLTSKDGAGTLVARVDNQQLVADVEGLAIASLDDGRRYLLASSQGDNAYAVYSLPGHEFVGRFRIHGGTIDGTSETDGIEVAIGDFGAKFPGGLFVAQDGDNAPEAQNFKFLAWDDIAAALGIK